METDGALSPSVLRCNTQSAVTKHRQRLPTHLWYSHNLPRQGFRGTGWNRAFTTGTCHQEDPTWDLRTGGLLPHRRELPPAATQVQADHIAAAPVVLRGTRVTKAELSNPIAEAPVKDGFLPHHRCPPTGATQRVQADHLAPTFIIRVPRTTMEELANAIVQAPVKDLRKAHISC